MVAVVVGVIDHTPPDMPSLKTVVSNGQTVSVPNIGGGVVFTVTVYVAIQPRVDV